MKPLELDFAPASLARILARGGVGSYCLLAAGVLACAGALYFSSVLLQGQHEQNASLLELRGQLAQQQKSQAKAAKVTIPQEQASAVNGAIEQLNLPWRDLLDAMEAATPATVALLSLEPDAHKKLIRVTAETKTSDVMIEYLAALRKQPFFQNVRLLKQEISEKDANKPWRFQVEMRWGSAAP